VLIGVNQPDCSPKKIDGQNADRDQHPPDDLLLFDLVAPSNNPFLVSDRQCHLTVRFKAFKRRGAADAS
jgi:hypothetical protein